MEFDANDLRYVVGRLPLDVRTLLKEHPAKLFVGGGFIRATVAGETPSDIDIFGHGKAHLGAVAEVLKDRRQRAKLHTTKNAITLLSDNRMPVQFITRWTFDTPGELIASFDFTVCQAAVWWTGSQWASRVGDRFFMDLAARRLVYTSPIREEEAGGSLLRAIKYTKRGYSIQISSLGAVVERLFSAVERSPMTVDGGGTKQVLVGLLREVDPLHVVDGMDIVDEHDPEGSE